MPAGWRQPTLPLSRRYTPEHHPGDQVTIGMDFSAILPLGVGITAPSLTIFTNRNPPTDAAADWTMLPIMLDDGTTTLLRIVGRAVYALVVGGQPYFDYQFRWRITDTQNNVWTRTGLMLCSYTS